jgi:hypothetical protein
MNKLGIDKIFRLASIKYVIKSIIILLVISFSNVAIADGGSAALYKGALSGDWHGEVMSVSVRGTFSISISAEGNVSGTYSGFESGTISGTVNASGNINAKGSAGISDWSGQLSLIAGRLSGSGTWSGYGGGGLWSSN